MNTTTRQHFDALNTVFAELLISETKDGLRAKLDNWREIIRKLNQSPVDELKNLLEEQTSLLIELFQFKVLATDPVWSEARTLFAMIEGPISRKNTYEEVFRNELETSGLGGMLGVT